MWLELIVVGFENMKVSTLQDSMHEESNMKSSVDVLRDRWSVTGKLRWGEKGKAFPR